MKGKTKLIIILFITIIVYVLGLYYFSSLKYSGYSPIGACTDIFGNPISCPQFVSNFWSKNETLIFLVWSTLCGLIFITSILFYKKRSKKNIMNTTSTS
jgi:tryptophan-rich sensory protein